VTGPRRSRLPFTRQILAMQVGVVALVLIVAFALIGGMLDRVLTDQYEQRALGVARAVAADPVVVDATAREDPDRLLVPYADRIRRATQALFVVVTDRRGIRLAHPNPQEVGKPVSTDASQVLAGHEVATIERGTLGLSARGKTPIRDPTGRVVGEVSVGFDARGIQRQIQHELVIVLLFAAAALALGVAASGLLARRLGRMTLGLEPHQLAELLQEREAVLRGVGEGVLAFDAADQVSVCNDEAARLLNLHAGPGTPLADLDLPGRLRTVLETRERTNELVTVVGDRLLVTNYREVHHDGRHLGGVLTVRDRTEVAALARELDAVRAVTDALRTQRHEFANRLHTISGLLHRGHHAEATEYLQNVSDDMTSGLDATVEAVRDPYLQAFFAVKTVEAAEKGVRLSIDPDSSVPGRLTEPVAVTTVVGNLVDNALDAALAGARRPATVDVCLLDDDGALMAQVVDSGDGVSPELRRELFAAGVSSRGAGRGLGLALARHAAHRLGGQVQLASPGGAEHGAIFVALLPSVIGYEAQRSSLAGLVD
jgi:two-component system CitB family sensor kinase